MSPTNIAVVRKIAHKSGLIKGVLPGGLSICAGWRATHIGINKASNGFPPSLSFQFQDVLGKLLRGERHFKLHNHMEVIIWINLMPSHNMRLARVRVQTINNRMVRLNNFIPYVAVGFNVIPAATVALVGFGADDGLFALETPPVGGVGEKWVYPIRQPDGLPINSCSSLTLSHLAGSFSNSILP